MSKASAYLRLNKSSASNFLGVPGPFSPSPLSLSFFTKHCVEINRLVEPSSRKR
jgi:hypothetical protein